MNHGFFSRNVYNSGDGTDRAAAFLAEHGYITLASDYRSWGDSDVGNSFFYSGLVIDVTSPWWSTTERGRAHLLNDSVVRVLDC